MGDFVTEHAPAGAETARLVVSELVTNAIMHGAEPVEVEVVIRSEGDVVRLAVSDGDPDTSCVLAPITRSDRPGGRGLRIVSALTRCWGTTGRADGKTVWAEFIL